MPTTDPSNHSGTGVGVRQSRASFTHKGRRRSEFDHDHHHHRRRSSSHHDNDHSDHHHHHHSHDAERFFVVPRACVLEYGPYVFHGVCDFRIERLQGIQKQLQKMGARIKLLPCNDFTNRVQLWYLDTLIFSCRLTDLHHGGDGELDPLCTEAALSFDHMSRKAIHGLRHRVELSNQELVTPYTACMTASLNQGSANAVNLDEVKKMEKLKLDDIPQDDSNKGSGETVVVYDNPDGEMEMTETEGGETWEEEGEEKKSKRERKSRKSIERKAEPRLHKLNKSKLPAQYDGEIDDFELESVVEEYVIQ